MCDCATVDNPSRKQLDKKIKAINENYYNLKPAQYGLHEFGMNQKFKYFERFSPTDIRKVLSFEGLIGGGHFGTVYKAYSRIDHGRKFAVKSISKYKISDRSLVRLQQELEILESIDHPNLVHYHGTFVDNQFIHIVMELCTGGELFEKITVEKKIEEKQAAKIVY